VHIWPIVAVALVALGLAVLAVLRAREQRRRAALYARYNRMRADRGMPPLTPGQIDFIAPRRRF
jgi:hypothetical protein